MAKTAQKNCPVCQKVATEKYQPFCSPRCANVDLGRWLGESYRIPVDEEPEWEEPTPPDVH